MYIIKLVFVSHNFCLLTTFVKIVAKPMANPVYGFINYTFSKTGKNQNFSIEIVIPNLFERNAGRIFETSALE